MRLKQQVISTLEQLAANGPEHLESVIHNSAERGYILGVSVEGTGSGASLSLADYDRYSATLRHLEISDNSLTINPSGIESYLHQCAAEIAHRLIYLDEPLALLELNTIDGVAQLRSSPPKRSPDEATYWEISIWVAPHPRVKLSRYQWTAKRAERIPITVPATFTTLGRLVEDLSAGLATRVEVEAQ